MIEVGKGLGSLKFDEVGERILAVIGAAERNKIQIITGATDQHLDISNANEIERIEFLPYKAWRIIGLGMLWRTTTTVNEDPVVEFGSYADPDGFGKMTATITGGEKFNVSDHQKYDPLNLLAPEVIAETSATMVTTWTEGISFNVWQSITQDLKVSEAAVAGMTTGIVLPYMLAEIKTGGRW